MSADVIELIDRMPQERRTATINRMAAQALAEVIEGVKTEPHLHLVEDKILYMSPPYMAPPTDCA